MAIQPPEPTEEDIERNWREYWYTRVCNEMGQIDPETLKWVLYDYTQLMKKIEAVHQLCLEVMVEAKDGGLTDADTLWPSEVLDVLGVRQRSP